MRYRIASVATGLAVLAAACQPPAPSFTPEDEAAVRSVFDAVVSNIRAGDFAAWAAQFADSAEFLPPNSPRIVGRAAIQTWAQANPPEEFGFSDLAIAGEGNLAYATSAMTIKLPGLPVDIEKQLVVLRRGADGTWRVVAVSVNSDLPMPGGPTAEPK
jgi:ketosteroid isomerase-like protein